MGALPDQRDAPGAVVHTATMAMEGELPVDADVLARLARERDAVRSRHRLAAAAARQVADTTVVSVLLGATGRRVTVHPADGAPALVGEVVAVGADVVELRSGSTDWWVPLAAIAAVEATDARPGDPMDRSTVELVDLLTDEVDSDRPVVVRLHGGSVLQGVVAGVGASLVLRLEHPERAAVVALERIAAVGRRG